MRLKPLTGMVVLAFIALGLLISAYFAEKRLNSRSGSTEVIVIDPKTTPVLPAGPNGIAPQDAQPGQPQVLGSPSAPDLKLDPSQPACKPAPEYTALRREIGVLVNSYERRNEPKKFIKLLEEFRLGHGLPVPVGLSLDQPAASEVIFDRCQRLCRETVFMAFVSRVEGGPSALVSTNSGLKSMRLEDSGLRLLTLDELNKKGVPFRSWVLPFSDGPFMVAGLFVYFPLDIFELWLKVDPKGQWSVGPLPKHALKLESVEAPMVTGCKPGENCFAAGEKKPRYFKSIRICPKN
jgi:hypothetical protein